MKIHLTIALSFSIILLAVKSIYFTLKGERAVAKNLEIPFLIDFYGEMLTKKQHDFLVYYYEEDLSLSEIAENEGITRQGVRDSIKRAEAQLYDMEERLGFAARFTEMNKSIDEIIKCAEVINEYNLNHSLSMEVNESVARIKTLASFLKEG